MPGESDPSRAPCQVLQSYLKPSHGVGPRFIEGPIHALPDMYPFARYRSVWPPIYTYVAISFRSTSRSIQSLETCMSKGESTCSQSEASACFVKLFA